MIEFILLIAGLIIALILDSISRIFLMIYLFFAFWFAYANHILSDTMAIFYLMGLLFYGLFVLTGVLQIQTNATQISIGKKAFTGVQAQIFVVIIGVAIYGIMYFLQSTRTYNIIGVPTMAITATSDLALVAGPMFMGLLGFIENRSFLVLFKFFSILLLYLKNFFVGAFQLLSFLIPVLPVLLTALAFGLMHIYAYQFAAGSIFFAAIVFTIWLITYLIFKDITPADVSHYLWNGIINLKEMGGLLIAT